jgi:hypothetical protein
MGRELKSELTLRILVAPHITHSSGPPPRRHAALRSQPFMSYQVRVLTLSSSAHLRRIDARHGLPSPASRHQGAQVRFRQPRTSRGSHPADADVLLARQAPPRVDRALSRARVPLQTGVSAGGLHRGQGWTEGAHADEGGGAVGQVGVLAVLSGRGADIMREALERAEVERDDWRAGGEGEVHAVGAVTVGLSEVLMASCYIAILTSTMMHSHTINVMRLAWTNGGKGVIISTQRRAMYHRNCHHT